MESFETFLDAVTAVGAAVAAVAAVIGVNAWRQQLRGNVEFEAARRALLATLKVRDSVKRFRNPFHPIEEINASGVEPGSRYERELYARRWESVSGALADLRVAELEGEVLWGAEYTEALKPLAETIRELKYNADDYLRRLEGAPGTDPESPRLAAAEAVVKAKVGKQAPDEFEKQMQDGVDSIETFLRPKLSGRRR